MTRYASLDKKDSYGCFYKPLQQTTYPNTSIIEAGSFKISNPSVITAFRIKSTGLANDSFAVAIGRDNPEQVIYELPLSSNFDYYEVNEKVAVPVPYSAFKVFIIVHQSQSPHDWLILAASAPNANIKDVQNAMTSECRSFNIRSVSPKPTNGFYADNIEIEMLFD